MQKFRDRLEELIAHLQISQAEMGARLGISRNMVSMLLRKDKEQNPSKAVLLLFEQEWESAFGHGKSMNEQKILPSRNFGAYQAVGRALLKMARERAGLTQKQLAEKVGYSLSVYQNIEDGSSNMSRKMALKVAAVLGVDAEDLLAGADEPPSQGKRFGTVGETPDVETIPGQKWRFAPLLSFAQCGGLHNGEMVAWDDGAYTHEGYSVCNPTDPNTFAVILAGDSMMPVFTPGDIAIIYPNSPPRNGGIVLAKLNAENGSGVMCKIYQASGNNVTLSSYNSAAYPPMTYQRQDFEWIYHVAKVEKIYPS